MPKALEGFGSSLWMGLLGLLPLVFYAWTLERGKAAPAFRSAWAPWVLLALLYLSVQASGGLGSSLWAAYPILVLLVTRHTGQGLALSTVIVGLEGPPLWASMQTGASPWPRALALGLPWLVWALGRKEPAKAPAVEKGPEPAVQSLSSQAPLPLQAMQPLDAEAMFEGDVQFSLDQYFHSHPDLNALTLWWGGPEGMSLRTLRLRQGQAALGATVDPGQGHLGYVLREREDLSLDPVPASAAAGLPYISGPYTVQALEVVLLYDEDKLVGLLSADKAASSFVEDERKALRSLARVLVQHAQRAAHLQALQEKSGRTQRLYEVSKTLAAQLDREAMVAQFGSLLQTLVPCDSWALGMREEEGGALRRLVSEGYAQDAPPNLSLDRSAALAGTLAHADDAVLFNRESGVNAPAALQEGLFMEAQSFLLAPLRQAGQLTGVLKLDRRKAPFSEEDREVAFIFASHAAVSLEHARLYTLHKKLATTDGLTGLYNHRYFQERLATEIEKAARTGKPLSLALTDIDFFKKFNDTFGHQEGDVVLKKVSRLVEAQVRPGKDVVCRYGGEEFVVILPECDVVEARQVMDAVRAYSAEHLIGGTGPEARAITMSVGISTFPQAAKEQRDLIHAADEALYKAKHEGRNKVCSFKDL